MRRRSQVKIKKLAFAYGTGWEYIPEDGEAGSVLTDIFLDLVEENRWRHEQIWRKQELEFQKAAPERVSGQKRFFGELAVKVSAEEHGQWLEKGSRAYMLQEQGEPVRFRTLRPLRLTAAKLQYAVYRKGLCAWLAYEAGGEEQSALTLFRQAGKELSHPVFHWYFPGLCDGTEDFGFEVEFHKEGHPAAPLAGKWTVSHGEDRCPAQWRQTASGFRLEGRMPGFAANLDKGMYEVRLELSPEEELTEEWMGLLCGGYVLKAAGEEREPDLCLTDSGAGENGTVLPFGTSPEEACCCYLACDRILAAAGDEVRLRFRERCLTEEKLPEPRPAELEKIYKKYPWLRQTETVREWQAEDTVWEYFNGNLWRPLPGSEAWKTGCHGEKEGARAYVWKCPRDMQPCVVEGEEHFYIRLRLRRVRNAYAMYYRKTIPVLEEIRFSLGERRILPAGQEIPDREEAGAERMYLGFDRDVTPDDCWYTGGGSRSFTEEMILGQGVRFGMEAFWVELTEKKEEELTCFQANHVPVGNLPGQEDDDPDMPRIQAGDVFYLEPPGMGMLEAVCLSDICCESAGAPVLSGRQAGEHYLARFGRLLTPMDMELMLQERYPLIQVKSCEFRQKDAALEVELAYPDDLDRGVRDRMIRKMAVWDNPGSAAEPEEALRSRLPEIAKWLEETLSAEGPVWLRECKCVLRLCDPGEPGQDPGEPEGV
ncbi:MAG: hypothetical protein NC420_10875 [Eubacterium sp.]|nr:hypothetical protein [Eubacterium sp.]MCM1213100.1 hypothetical protein [Lachnospiraceae bacterium]MCM1239406.1 hypothetical protein [Lachnospiraceae bacterium]